MHTPFRGKASVLCTLLLCLSLVMSTSLSLALAQEPGPADAAGPRDGIQGTSGGLAAAGVLPSSLFDPDSIGWASRRDMSSSAFSDWFNQMKDEYMLIDIEVDEVNGQQRVAGVWQRNTDNRGWAEHRNLTSSQFHDKWVSYRDQGYRLIDQEAYTLGGTRYYAGIWVENREGLAWASFRNLTSQEFSNKFQEYSKNGYIMVDVEGYPTSSGLRYAMIWVENTEGLAWVEYRNLSSQEFADKFNQLKATYRVLDVESYRHNGVQYYAGIWVENRNGRAWAEYRDMTETGWRNRWYRMRDLGYRLVDFEIYPTGSGYRYAGVWRQNTDRPDWPLKAQVDSLAQAYMAQNDLPGMSVAIAQGGVIRYMRGFGYQDVGSGVWYSARTLNRLASVSKAVAGVLAMRLLQKGTLADLDDPTADYIASLPAHHTHTLRQLLSNRSGIGHYEDYNVPIQAYATALAAAQTFWNTDSDPNTPGTQLVYMPGAGCKYSTHAYTVLGAALEGATGKSIGAIVEDELSAPFNLPTLQMEDRSDGDANRTRLYGTNNAETTPDDISWKVLGGGLEASAYDLVRFGMKILDGTILSQASRDELWSVPAPVFCTAYALGWSVGTEQGTPVVAKDGAQRGARTYMRIYPEQEIVIVILSNRRNGHNPGNLGRDIGALMLDNLPKPPATPYWMDGIAHFALGDTQVFWNEKRQLVAQEIGDGQDEGISIQPGDAYLWRGDLALGFDIQSRLPMTLSLTSYSGASARETSRLLLRARAGGLELLPSFSGRQVRVQFLQDDTLVHESTVPSTGPAATSPFDLVWCILESPPGTPTELCRILVEHYRNQAGNWEWNLRLAGPVLWASGDGQRIRADRVRMEALPAGPRASTGADATIAQVRVRAANLETLVFLDEFAGGPESIPPGPGGQSGNPTIFLPVVVR